MSKNELKLSGEITKNVKIWCFLSIFVLYF